MAAVADGGKRHAKCGFHDIVEANSRPCCVACREEHLPASTARNARRPFGAPTCSCVPEGNDAAVFEGRRRRTTALFPKDVFDDMARKDPVRKDKASMADGAMSLFDRDNLEFLDALRYGLERISAATATAARPKSDPTASADASDADHLFERYWVSDDDERWDMGELNVKIIHRGRIRINRAQWQQVIQTCSDGLVEAGIRKDFYLNIFLHPSNVRLIYVTYRYKQSSDKQREFRRGILVDEASNIREMMMHLAYWFTAQPHAEKNYPVWNHLVEQAMAKLRAAG